MSKKKFLKEVKVSKKEVKMSKNLKPSQLKKREKIN